jgi:hypothetical protein
MDYWRGTATPFLDRDYARFCLSLPRSTFDDRKLLGDVVKRYYGKLAAIPGSYADEPYILSGTYIAQRRVARALPPFLRRKFAAGFEERYVDINFGSIQAHGKDAFWPLFNRSQQVADWIDVEKLEPDFQLVMQSSDNILSLRRLQAMQTLAYRLIDNKEYTKHL